MWNFTTRAQADEIKIRDIGRSVMLLPLRSGARVMTPQVQPALLSQVHKPVCSSSPLQAEVGFCNETFLRKHRRGLSESQSDARCRFKDRYGKMWGK